MGETDGIAVVGICKRLDGRWVLDGASLHIGAGERCVLSGASGTGKTTLLRLIAGLEVPESGYIDIDGARVTGGEPFVAPHKRGLGVVLQQPTLWPSMTVAGNLAFVMGRARDRQQRILALAERIGFAELLGRRPQTLSAGQAQRVALGRALAAEPRYLLLDEPTSNLDAEARDQLNAVILDQVAEQGVGLLYISHDEISAAAIAGRRLLLSDRRITEVGTARLGGHGLAGP
ncbi:ATP-binding cassette domain-containing protein [Thiorhodococcus minor]|uniref:ATP-binding cassette domain-containing protein n=1 Tax=Thiorhodococcus minor TaxID=57489 RepID=A0A6M0JUF3_9GAMM|nr:ATP-binding cassette domain-containing protein [Thiorhodococcus minor]NEV61166.1 ATP-binding cassette domain-containing protein [Thiorhodococcus minor]